MTGNFSGIGYEFLDPTENFLYEARETGKTHTPFRYEILLFNSIQNGDVEGVTAAINLYKGSGLIIGHMSDHPLREIHYWAVSIVAQLSRQKSEFFIMN